MGAKRSIRLFFGRILKQLSTCRAFGASLSSGGVWAVIDATSRHRENTEKKSVSKEIAGRDECSEENLEATGLLLISYSVDSIPSPRVRIVFGLGLGFIADLS